jgi:GNAT superfamily N-acetyltransferase
MKIQKAQKEDLQEILDLQKLCYTENAQRYNDFNIAPLIQTISDLEAEFAQMVILKAIEGQNIVGSVRAIEREGTCYIGRLYVYPGHQNKGIGKQLILAIENEFNHVGRYELFTAGVMKKTGFLSKIGI